MKPVSNYYKTFAESGTHKVITVLYIAERVISANQASWANLQFTEQVATLPFRCWQARGRVPQPSGTPAARTPAGNQTHEDLHG